MRRIAAILLIALIGWPTAADELATPTWDMPVRADWRNQVMEWTSELELAANQQRQVDAIWDELNDETDISELFEAVVRSTAIALPDTSEMVERALAGDSVSLADFELLELPEKPAWVSANLRLLFGKSFALGQLYDEAKTQLADIEPSDVADPAAMFFYQAVGHYRLREKKEGIAALDTLLQREADLPDRYANLAKLMRLDIEKLEPDSLDEIARIMDSIQVRLGHGHAGARVRKEEQDVIDKLDKMIEDLEEQLRQMQAMAAGSSGGLQSNSPAQDSYLPDANAQGDVGRKSLGQESEWGNLPPKQREESLQKLGKEFPSHYRDIIEEYFRKLAQEDVDEQPEK